MSKWGAIAERVSALAMDESFDWPEYPNDKANLNKLRCGIGATNAGRLLRFLIRSLPEGGIRIIRAGTWGSPYLNSIPTLTTKQHRVLVYRIKSIRNTHAREYRFVFHFPSMHRRDVKLARCSFKSCVYPARSEGVCRVHERFWDYPSFLWKGDLSKRDIYDLSEKQYSANFSVTYGQDADAMEKSLNFHYSKTERNWRKKKAVNPAMKNYNRMRKEEFEVSQ